MLGDTDLGAVLPGLPVVPVTGMLYRGIDWAYHATVNSVIGSLKAHGRYHHSDDALGTIYIAETHSGAADELRQGRQTLFPTLQGQAGGATTVIAPFPVSFTGLLDLRDHAVQAALGTSLMELTGLWRVQQGRLQQGRIQPSPRTETQRLARAAHAAGLEGLIYTSAVGAYGNNVVVFSSNLTTQMQATLPLDFLQQSVQYVGQI